MVSSPSENKRGKAMNDRARYPSIWHMAARAKARMPFFAWEYLDSGTGQEHLLGRNHAALDRVQLTPRVLGGRFDVDLQTRLFGQTFSVPFGISPVGLSSLMWPGTEKALAQMAKARGIPYGLSLVANETPEDIARLAGETLWMQLYAPHDPKVLEALVTRFQEAGITTLIFTVDVPVGSSRERQLAAGLTVPPAHDLRTLWRIAQRPAWALATARNGAPRFKTLERYFPQDMMQAGAHQVTTLIDGRPDWGTLDRLRKLWPGTLVLKGIMHSEDAARAVDHGVDAVWVSNHGGRQFDAAPAAIDALPGIATTIGGQVPILYDSGIRGGLDIIRALSLGADFCFLGRAFLIASAALGQRGPDLAYEILRDDMVNNMIQIGAGSVEELRGLAVRT